MSELLSPRGQPVHVEVYTDGGCDPNPGPGGWAAIIRLEEREWVLQGNDPDTTNNRMELQAATAALALLERLLGRCQVDLYTDSQYTRQGITDGLICGCAMDGRRSTKSLSRTRTCGERCMNFRRRIRSPGIGRKDTLAIR